MGNISELKSRSDLHKTLELESGKVICQIQTTRAVYRVYNFNLKLNFVFLMV